MSEGKRMARLAREFMIQERRYQRAKRKAQKHIRLAEAWNRIMGDACMEQNRINKELGTDDQEDEP